MNAYVSLDEENASYYIAAIGALNTFATYIESTRSLWHGVVTGAIAIGIMVGVGLLAARVTR